MKHFSISSFFLLLIFLMALYQPVIAQNFHLVKDINTSTDANPDNAHQYYYNTGSNSYAVLNGISYFNADDGLHGGGLWRSDGTTAGTYSVKDSVGPQNIVVANGKLFFTGTGITGIYVSDGTTVGTHPAFDTLSPGYTNYPPNGLTVFKGVIYFIASGKSANCELWKTDGTAAGTVMVKDFYNSNNPSLYALTVMKNKLYINTYGYYANAFQLWISDGSATGTHIVSRDLYEPAQLVAASDATYDSLVYFTAGPSLAYSLYRSIYVTNGDSGNYKIPSGFNGVVENNINTEKLINIAGVLYFIGHPANFSYGQQDLYKFDVNAGSGIEPVQYDFVVYNNLNAPNVSNLNNDNGTLYFNVFDEDNNKNQFWKSNGTMAGNVLLKDSFYARNFLDVNGVIYFSGGSNTSGYELWKTDGTVRGTSMVKDIRPGINSSNPTNLTTAAGKILFSARDGVHGNELWQSDGTLIGTSLVKDINATTTASSSPTYLTPFQSSVIVSASSDTGYLGIGLWKTDGTTGGTAIINDTISNIQHQSGKSFTKLNNVVYYFGTSVSGRQGIYKTDGTAVGTALIKDFSPVLTRLDDIVATKLLAYFSLYNYSAGTSEIWRTDGTLANTYLIKSRVANQNITSIFPADSTLYFASPASTELWKSDGTVAGTVLLKSFTYGLDNLFVHKDNLYFSGRDNNISGLWRSDGTAAGTVNLAGNNSIYPNTFASAVNLLFFTGSGQGIYGNIGTELFVTDGTVNGTVLVKDIHAGSNSTSIYSSVSFNGLLYFFTNRTTTGGIELWKSDGTFAGTQLVTGLGVDENSYINPPVICNGKFFFILTDKLWQSDGTQSGTHPVADTILAGLTFGFPYLTSAGNQLFFTAYNHQYGTELYAGNITAPIILYITAANGNWNDPATWTGNVVPPAGANVIIRHMVTGNINTTCNTLNVETAGQLTLNTGISIKILQ